MDTSSALAIDYNSPEWDLQGAIDFCPETPAELHQYIRTYCRTETGTPVRIPARRMCPGHSAPFEFISDAFFGLADNQLVKANRNGGKTLDFAVLADLGMYHLGAKYPLKVMSIGGVEDQARRCFAYSAAIMRQPEFRHAAGRGILKESIILLNGSELTTTVATMNGVNGPHVPWLHLDEWELWKAEIAQQALSIPESQGPHRASVRIGSTQKYALGMMQTFLEEAPARGFKVYLWCIWETIEQCRDRSCSSCPLFQWSDHEGGELCGGRAKDARGFYSIDDTIKKAKTLDRRTFEEEWLCLRPSREGIVFGREYREDMHRVRYDVPYSPGLPLFVTIDQGFTNPFAVEIVQVDEARNELRFIGELYRTETLPEDMGREAALLLEELGVPTGTKFVLISDPEDPAAARTFAKHLKTPKGREYHAMLRYRGLMEEIEEKLGRCRRRLKIEPGRPPRLVISSRVKWLPYELTQYRYPTPKKSERPVSEKPVDKDNHAVSSWYRLEAYLAGPPIARTSSEPYM